MAMFGCAAAHAAIFELKARLLADAVPELRGSITASLDPLLREILSWMVATSKGTAKDREHVRRCGRLRNKLLHAELSRATGQLVELGAVLRGEDVQMFTWEGALTAEKLTGAIAAGGASVAKTRTGEGLVFAWLLQSSASGAFGAAVRAFNEGAEILERALPGYRDGESDGNDHDATR